MKTSKARTIIAIILSVILLIVGFYTWNSLFTALLPNVRDIKYFETDLETVFRSSILFGLILSLIPIMTILIWRFAPVITTAKRILTVCIIVAALLVSLLARREMIKSKARNLHPTITLDYTDPANVQTKPIESGIPVPTLHFELFAFAGLLAGSVIAFFSLRSTKRG